MPFSYPSIMLSGNRTQMETQWRLELSSNITAIYVQTRAEDSANRTTERVQWRSELSANNTDIRASIPANITALNSSIFTASSCALLTGSSALCDGNDATGSSAGLTQYINYTSIDYGSNITGATNLDRKSIMTLPLAANKNISLECDLNQYSVVGTTGLIWNMTVTGTRILNINYRMDYPTTATATATCPLTLALQRTVVANPNGDTYFPCLQTGTGQAPRSARLTGILNTNASPGLLNVSFRTEITNSNVNVTTGSWCRVTELP